MSAPAELQRWADGDFAGMSGVECQRALRACATGLIETTDVLDQVLTTAEKDAALSVGVLPYVRDATYRSYARMEPTLHDSTMDPPQ